MTLLEQCRHEVARARLLLHVWLRTNFMCAWSREWPTLWPLRKFFLLSIFVLGDFSRSVSCYVLDIEPAEISVIKEVGVFTDRIVQE